MANTSSTTRFDYAAFRRAFSAKDARAWSEFYAEEAEWIEYRQGAPPRAPHRMVGKGGSPSSCGRWRRRTSPSS